VSTAVDQVKLAEAAMQIPTFADIVRLPQATLPVAGVVYNVNADLGRAGIIGIKTGSTTAAGGCLVVARQLTLDGKAQLVVAAVLGQRGPQPLPDALAAGERLMQAAPGLLASVQPVPAGRVAARLVAPWTQPLALRVPSPAPSFVGWGGLGATTRLSAAADLRPGRAVAAGQQVATLTVAVGGQQVVVPLRAPAAIARPSLAWRLTRR
jgi:D-alanyl-D-alanine carboxypeptidase (penicillin-binding protein 5/6)